MGVAKSTMTRQYYPFFGLFLYIISVSGHGNMVWPPVWQDARGKWGLIPMGHSYIGAEIVFENDVYYDGQVDFEKSGMLSMWYTNGTWISVEPTIEDHMRTFANTGPEFQSRITNHPWMAPGAAPVFSGCGVAGGNPYGCALGDPMGPGQDCGGVFKGGFSYGPRAEDFNFPDIVTTEWTRGKTAEVGWGVLANHGGGYSYRLCKLGASRSELTEECFQKTPLRFANNLQWIQTGHDLSTRRYFVANRTTVGTYPPGSEWTKNPVTNCAGFYGGAFDYDPNCPNGFQFTPHLDGLWGEGTNYFHIPEFIFPWTVMDEVMVPEDIEPGDYVLSFRWDCEQTPQVWNACSNIRIL